MLTLENKVFNQCLPCVRDMDFYEQKLSSSQIGVVQPSNKQMFPPPEKQIQKQMLLFELGKSYYLRGSKIQQYSDITVICKLRSQE